MDSGPQENEIWYVYMVQSIRTGYVYIGCSNDYTRRIYEHNNTRKGAKCLRGQRPVRLIWCAEVADGKIPAMRIEWWLKRRPRIWRINIASGKTQLTLPEHLVQYNIRRIDI